MNRAEFMAGLSVLLSDITEEEREEALSYYEDYFDDAGAENEASVIASLGTPEKVAAIIKDGLKDNDDVNGEFSERGYSNPAYDSRDEIRENTFLEKVQKSDKKSGIWIIILILCLFGLPIVVPVAASLLSAALAVLCAIVVIIFVVIIVGIVIVVTGAVLGISGIVTLLVSPITAILLIGAGLIVGGIGVLITILGAWIIKKVVPPALRGITGFIAGIFDRRRG